LIAPRKRHRRRPSTLGPTGTSNAPPPCELFFWTMKPRTKGLLLSPAMGRSVPLGRRPGNYAYGDASYSAVLKAYRAPSRVQARTTTAPHLVVARVQGWPATCLKAMARMYWARVLLGSVQAASCGGAAHSTCLSILMAIGRGSGSLNTRRRH
jgi:hypothetical protein